MSASLRSTGARRGWWAFGAAGLFCLAAFVWRSTASGGPGGEVTLEVEGALNISAYCGGEDTHYADGERISFVPEGPTCDVEAPLSPVMPLRGRVELPHAGQYLCERRDMSIVCR